VVSVAYLLKGAVGSVDGACAFSHEFTAVGHQTHQHVGYTNPLGCGQVIITRGYPGDLQRVYSVCFAVGAPTASGCCCHLRGYFHYRDPGSAQNNAGWSAVVAGPFDTHFAHPTGDSPVGQLCVPFGGIGYITVFEYPLSGVDETTREGVLIGYRSLSQSLLLNLSLGYYARLRQTGPAVRKHA